MVNNKRRTLCIGDIHGGLKALIQVLERAKVTTEDRLIFLGDYVDGWADSAPLISYLIELNNTHECIFIRGNHDSWCEGWLTYGTPHNEWTIHGGKSTITSYMKNDLLHNSSHTMFFYKMNNYYIDDENRLFVHGGYTSDYGVIDTPSQELYWNRDLFHLAYMIELRTKDNIEERKSLFPTRLKLYNEIFVGHTSTSFWETGYQPLHALNMWNLDTGCGTNGMLTIMDVNTKEYWQSDSLPTLYPDDLHMEFANLFRNNEK